MATFKASDRARIRKDAEIVQPSCRDALGTEVTLLRYYGFSTRLGTEWVVTTLALGTLIVPEVYLEPLTDPKADAFLESVKSWKPEPVAPPLPVKESA